MLAWALQSSGPCKATWPGRVTAIRVLGLDTMLLKEIGKPQAHVNVEALACDGG